MEGDEAVEKPSEAAPGPPDLSASAGIPHAVFLSYASHDAEIANSICQFLESRGASCWMAPRDVPAGALYADAIVRAINEAEALAVVLSKSAVASSHVGKEIERASSKNKKIIAFRIDPAPLTPALEYFLSESQWIDVPALGMSAALVKLKEAVRQGLTSSIQSTPIPSTKSNPPAGQSSKRIAVLAAAVAIGVGVAVALGVHFWSSNHSLAKVPTTVAITDKSIAVLPFADMSEKKDQEYFADGMAEEILDLLAKLPGLRVIGRTSSFQFKGKTDDLRKIGSALGAAYVVEGSVRKSGDRLRITAQLIETHNGSHVWSDTYDDTIGDVLKVQDRISIGLVRALQVTVGADDLQSPTTIKNAQAYELYLRGRHAMDRGDKASVEGAVGYFQQALELDPSFIRAVEWLAFAQFDIAALNWAPPRDSYERARASIKRGLALNPNSGGLHALMALILGQYDWDWSAADDEAKRALVLDPHDVGVLESAANVFFDLGRWDEAARLLGASLAIDPLNFSAHWDLATVRIRTGRFSEAEDGFRKALEISPNAAVVHSNLGWTLLYEGKLEEALAEMRQEPTDLRDWGPALVYHRMGRKAESDAALAKYTKEHADDDPYGIADIHAYRGETDEAFAWLDRAYNRRQAWLYYVKGNPDFKSIEADSRYKAFLRKLNLPE